MVTDESDPVLFLIEDYQPLVEEEIAQDESLVDGGRKQVHAQHADPIVETSQHVSRRRNVEG